MSSVKRIEKYLLSKEIDGSHIQFNNIKENNHAITIENGNFYWHK
jgi:transcription elongation factor GreA-like protein